MQFDHVGIPTSRQQPGMTFVEATRVWITDAQSHPFRVEWLRYEADSPVTGPLRETPHVGFRVDSVEEIGRLSAGCRSCWSRSTWVSPWRDSFKRPTAPALNWSGIARQTRNCHVGDGPLVFTPPCTEIVPCSKDC